LLREEALEQIYSNEIGKLEDEVADGFTPLPKPLGLLDKAKHFIEELTGRDLGLMGKNGERYPEEYMREKQQIYEGATKQNRIDSKKFQDEYRELLTQHYLDAMIQGGNEPTEEQRKTAKKMADDKIIEGARELRKNIHEHEAEAKKPAPPINGNLFFPEPQEARLKVKEADVAIALSAPPPPIPVGVGSNKTTMRT
jgi:hypothetical protein